MDNSSLRTAREASGLTRKQLGALAGVHPNSIYNYEHGLEAGEAVLHRLTGALEIGLAARASAVADAMKLLASA